MDVREKLALAVCNATQKTNYKCDFKCEKKGKCAYCLVMAEQIIAHGVTVQEWISVKDKLPDVCDSYIVCGKMKYSHEKEWEIFTDVAGSYGDYIDGFWDTFNDWNEGQEIHITHWMPLPQPPKGE